MAPKRGGGGGGGGRSSFRGSSCSDSAFTLTVSIIQLSFAAFWFLVYIGLAVLSGRRKKRILAASHAKEQLQWGMLTAAIVFRIM